MPGLRQGRRYSSRVSFGREAGQGCTQGRVVTAEGEVGKVETRADGGADVGELAHRLGSLPPVGRHHVARAQAGGDGTQHHTLHARQVRR